MVIEKLKSKLYLNSLLRYIERNWEWFIVGVAFFGFLLNVAIFYPGYMSNDSINQLRQSLGIDPRIDLFPPIMTIVWRALIAITGAISSMLIFQLAMLWAGLCLLSLYVYRRTHIRKLSLMVLFIALLPFVINISGVIWKDNQMTFALILAVAIILHMSTVKKLRWKVVLLSVSSLLIMYACLVRYNATPALIPVIFMMFRQSGLLRNKKNQILATAIYCVGLVLAASAMNFVMNVKSSNPINAVMIDDIVNVNIAYESDAYKHSTTYIKQIIASIAQCSSDKNVSLNNIWVCASESDREMILYKYPQEIKDIWLQSVLKSPLQYALYRTYTFTLFMFPEKNNFYIWQNGIIPNELGLTARSSRAGAIVNIYVTNFAYRYFPFLFEPWFWMGVNIALLVLARRLIRYRLVVVTLTVSSILYMLSFLPTGATVDYRYIYWPVMASVMSVILLYIDLRLKDRGDTL